MYAKALNKTLKYAFNPEDRRRKNARQKNSIKRKRHTKTMVQHSARPATPAPAVHRRGDRATRRRHSPKNIPQRNHRTRNQPGTLDKHPRRSPGNLQDLETQPAVSSIRPRE